MSNYDTVSSGKEILVLRLFRCTLFVDLINKKVSWLYLYIRII